MKAIRIALKVHTTFFILPARKVQFKFFELEERAIKGNTAVFLSTTGNSNRNLINALYI